MKIKLAMCVGFLFLISQVSAKTTQDLDRINEQASGVQRLRLEPGYRNCVDYLNQLLSANDSAVVGRDHFEMMVECMDQTSSLESGPSSKIKDVLVRSFAYFDEDQKDTVRRMIGSLEISRASAVGVAQKTEAN